METVYLYATGPNGPITVPVKRLDDVAIIAAILHDDPNICVGGHVDDVMPLREWLTARDGGFCHSVGLQE